MSTLTSSQLLSRRRSFFNRHNSDLFVDHRGNATSNSIVSVEKFDNSETKFTDSNLSAAARVKISERWEPVQNREKPDEWGIVLAARQVTLVNSQGGRLDSRIFRNVKIMRKGKNWKVNPETLVQSQNNRKR